MSKAKVWAFYDEKDNERLAFVGTINECAEWLGTTPLILHQSMSHIRHGRAKLVKARYSFIECEKEE